MVWRIWIYCPFYRVLKSSKFEFFFCEIECPRSRWWCDVSWYFCGYFIVFVIGTYTPVWSYCVWIFARLFLCRVSASQSSQSSLGALATTPPWEHIYHESVKLYKHLLMSVNLKLPKKVLKACYFMKVGLVDLSTLLNLHFTILHLKLTLML